MQQAMLTHQSCAVYTESFVADMEVYMEGI